MKCLPCAEMEAGAEIFGDAADQKRRVESGGVEDPRQHGGRRGLAVSSGDDQHFFAAQEFVVQQLRKRAERDALVEDVLQFYVAAGHGIADDDQVGPRLQVLASNGCATGMPRSRKKIGHRRIGGGIGTGDAKAALLQHSGERRHRGAADADQVNVFRIAHALSDQIQYHMNRHTKASLQNLGYRQRASLPTSKIFRLLVLSCTVSFARTPNGSVMLPDVTWPERTPKATGTPRSPTMRVTTSCERVVLICASVRNRAFRRKRCRALRRSCPASFSCINMRSI